MNREIKFRAWDEKKSIIRIVKQIDLCGFVTYEDIAGEDWQSDFILMQFTGLKDRNGEEIYEGDILQDSRDETWKYEVKYSNTMPIFYADGLEDEVFTVKLAKNYLEIIGNIYENPELIENNLLN